MILNIIVFKNKKIGAFSNPQFLDIEPVKAAVQLSRSLKLNQGKKEFMDLDMYFLGTFDDETGVITQVEPVFLLDCSTCFTVVTPKNEVKEGGDDNVVD